MEGTQLVVSSKMAGFLLQLLASSMVDVDQMIPLLQSSSMVDVDQMAPLLQPSSMVDVDQMAPLLQPSSMVDVDQMAPLLQPSSMVDVDQMAPLLQSSSMVDVDQMAPLLQSSSMVDVDQMAPLLQPSSMVVGHLMNLQSSSSSAKVWLAPPLSAKAWEQAASVSSLVTRVPVPPMVFSSKEEQQLIVSPADWGEVQPADQLDVSSVAEISGSVED